MACALGTEVIANPRKKFGDAGIREILANKENERRKENEVTIPKMTKKTFGPGAEKSAEKQAENLHTRETSYALELGESVYYVLRYDILV